MSNILQKAYILSTNSRTPLTQFQRFRGKINIQRPRQPHYERARVIAVTQPAYPEKPKTNTCFEEKISISKIENPYNEIIAREVRNWLNNSRLIAIFHQNSIKADELFKVRVLLHKQNMHLKSYGSTIMRKAVENSKFETILQLFESSQCIVFSPDQPVAQLLRITRRVPQLILLGGIIDDRLMSRNEMMAYAQLPNIQGAQAELVQTLNLAAGRLVENLEAHQNNLVNVLDVYVKENSAEPSVEVPAENASSEDTKQS